MALVKIGADTWIDLEKVVAIVQPGVNEPRFAILLASVKEVLWLPADATQLLLDKLSQFGLIGD